MKKQFFGYILIIFLFSTPLYAQQESSEAPMTLELEYEQMVENSETFQQYKVIPIAKMKSFKESMADTLNRYKSTIKNIKDKKNAVDENNDSLQQKVASLKIELAETKELVDGIQFFGMTITKTLYNVILWGTIIALLVLLVFLNLAFLNANRGAKQAKNDKLRVDDELEELRKTAHEKQVKVKRELQTALNKIDELTK